MVSVLTLIANINATDCAIAIQRAVQAAKMSAGIPSEINWLSENEAVQLVYPAGRFRELSVLGPKISNDYLLDHCVCAGRPAPAKLFLADMEATIIQQEMVDELAAITGQAEQVSQITQMAMEGNFDFEQSLRQRTKFFKGVEIERLESLKSIICYTPGAKTLVKTMAQCGAETVLVSGGYSVFASHVAEDCGFDRWYSNHPETQDGVLTGELVNPVFDARAKREILKVRATELNILRRQTCAIGDGANDVMMLKACGLAASYHGKPIAISYSDIAIKHGDMTALLFAQGIARNDFSALH